jgi:hypothetical protein
MSIATDATNTLPRILQVAGIRLIKEDMGEMNKYIAYNDYGFRDYVYILKNYSDSTASLDEFFTSIRTRFNLYVSIKG